MVPLGFEPRTHRYERYMFTVYTTEPYYFGGNSTNRTWILGSSDQCSSTWAKFPYIIWWNEWDLNPRPSACKADALPLSYRPIFLVLNVGIEPTACWLQVSCSSQSELIQHIFGVQGGTRTHRIQFLRLTRIPIPSPTHILNYLAYPLGLEPRLTVLETVVLIH